MRQSTTRLRVRYAETDQMGVVYYANYFVWFEVARTDLLRDLGWSYREMEDAGIVLPVIEASCQYSRPARYDEELEIMTEGVLSSRVRMEFRYEVRVQGTPTAIATGRTGHAALTKAGRPCRLPARILEAFA
jgi:acyl-CoA thioester hydrolase